MSLRSKIEEHVGLAVAGFVIAGFVAGAGAVAFMYDRFGGTASVPSSSAYYEGIERQIDSLIADHKSRMTELQTQYLEAEKEASSFGHIDQSHQWWVDSAERLARSDCKAKRRLLKPGSGASAGG